MQLTLGQKIRELRKRDGRTQEALAEVLGVTSQAISRWEANGGYPDMEMIPAIANYFHISIDELFGYHSDREEKINSILEEADRILKNQGFTFYQGSVSEDIEKSIDMLRNAAEEFPNEPKILLKLAQSLHMWGYNQYGAKGYCDDDGILNNDIEYNSKNTYWKESLIAYEKVLKANPSPVEREIAICQMTPLYCKMGKFEEAKALAEAQNSILICKEMLLPEATAGEEMARYQGERIMALLQNLRLSVYSAIVSKVELHTSEYKSKIETALINLYETVFEDGRCGHYHRDLGHMYMNLADYESHITNDFQKAQEYFDKGFDHYSEYERILREGDYAYTSPLVSNLPPIKNGELRILGEDFWKKEMKFFPDDLKNELRKNEKYSICFE